MRPAFRPTVTGTHFVNIGARHSIGPSSLLHLRAGSCSCVRPRLHAPRAPVLVGRPLDLSMCCTAFAPVDQRLQPLMTLNTLPYLDQYRHARLVLVACICVPGLHLFVAVVRTLDARRADSEHQLTCSRVHSVNGSSFAAVTCLCVYCAPLPTHPDAPERRPIPVAYHPALSFNNNELVAPRLRVCIRRPPPQIRPDAQERSASDAPFQLHK